MGNILSTLKKQEGRSKVPQHIENLVRQIRYKTKNIADKSLSAIRAVNETYYKMFAPISEKSWPFFLRFRHYSPKLVFTLSDKTRPRFNEPFSDSCLSHLLGTVGGKSRKCVIPAKCWTTMTLKGQNNYALTHQMIYFQFGVTHGRLYF